MSSVSARPTTKLACPSVNCVDRTNRRRDERLCVRIQSLCESVSVSLRGNEPLMRLHRGQVSKELSPAPNLSPSGNARHTGRRHLYAFQRSLPFNLSGDLCVLRVATKRRFRSLRARRRSAEIN